mmetsp:Transcript_12391/g.33193  ORF Transcript_12391/g.33193 Transcript_12391/m.33193 type:complete len:97 (-) Transcript_12391:989-1279(-)
MSLLLHPAKLSSALRTPPFRSYRAIDIYCSACKAYLYRYRKGGNGSLVKCIEERILKDYTKGDLHCPECGSQFARLGFVKNKRAHFVIKNRVYYKK